MRCAQCHDLVGGDWIEWTQRHLLRLGDQGVMATTVTAVILCPPPRVCTQEWAEVQVNTEAVLQSRELGEVEPF